MLVRVSDARQPAFQELWRERVSTAGLIFYGDDRRYSTYEKRPQPSLTSRIVVACVN